MRHSSGPPSPWGTGETKKRTVDALKNENSEIHHSTGDISAATGGCAKVNYAKIQELYAPKHEMNKFHPNLKRLIEVRFTKRSHSRRQQKRVKNMNLVFLASRIQVVPTHFYMINTFSILAGLVE